MIPTFSEIQELFRSDRSVWLKMLGGALIGGLFALAGVLQGRSQQPGDPQFIAKMEVSWVIAAIVIGAIMAAALSMRDVVHRRIKEGRRVNPMLRLYFGMRFASLSAWIFTIFALTVLLIACTL